MGAIKHLLPPQLRWCKAALHTHTTISDGEMTPEEVKAAYKERGYQILAVTDHNVISGHPRLSDEDFVVLTGIEVNVDEDHEEGVYWFYKSYHLNMIAKDPNNRWQPVKIPGYRDYARPYEAQIKPELMDRTHSVEAINAMIKRANEEGFLVMYNHPYWSLHTYPDYAELKGLWAVEVYNSGENSEHVYHELAALGNPVVAVGADDSHNLAAIDRAWAVVGVEELSYPGVIRALERGDLYATTGPVIHSLYLQDSTLYIQCSEAVNITLVAENRLMRQEVAPGGCTVTGAQFRLTKFLERMKENPDGFLRVKIQAADGTCATTRAYRFRELLNMD